MRTTLHTRSVGLLVVIAAALTACGGDGLDTFNVDMSSTATIPKGSVLEQLAGGLPFSGEFTNFDISESQDFQNQGVKKSEIDSVRLAKLELVITSPATGQDFTFLQDLEFYVEAQGLERKRVARAGPFEPGQKTVTMALDGVELAAYVAAPAMSLTTEANGKRPNNDTTLQAKTRLRIDVNVAGLVK